jgi:putative methionine-R-sulfoxide reductase with GAF domain
MKNLKYLNIVLFLLVIFFVILVIGTISQHEIQGKTYFFLLMIIITGMAFLGLNLLSFEKEKAKTDRKRGINSDDDVKQEIEENSEIFEEINFKEWVQNFLKSTTYENHTDFAESLLRLLSKEFEVVQGLYFGLDKASGKFTKLADYAYYSDIPPREFMVGETISGQVAKNQKTMKIADIPDGYITVLSGLGSSSPSSLLIVPVIHKNETIGIVELAFFKEPGEKEIQFFEEMAEKAGAFVGKFIIEKSSEKKK